jgi:hypothetical protein
MLSPRTPAVTKEAGVAVIALDELKIPKGLRPVVEEIVGITDSEHRQAVLVQPAAGLRPGR